MCIYYSLSICVSSKKYFKSHDKKQSPMPALEMMLLKSIFVSRRDSEGDAVTYHQYSMSLPTVNCNRKGSGLKVGDHIQSWRM